MPQPSMQGLEAYPHGAGRVPSQPRGPAHDEAAQALIRLIRRNPDDADAVQMLRDHYYETGDHASLANLMDGWGDRLADVVEACTAHVEAGDAALRFGDRARAEASYGKALQRDPLQRTSFRRLMILLEEEGEHIRLCQWLKHLLHAVEERGDTSRPAQRAELHEKLGDLLDRQLGRPDEAVEHYRSAFEIDVERASAISKAREIYRGAGNLQAAAVLYEFEIRAAADAPRQTALLTELAQMRSEHMGDIDGGIACLRRALRLAPKDVELLYTLARLLVHRSQTREGRAQLADLKRAAELYCAAARTSSNEDAAFYVGAALRLVPDHPKALELQARLEGSGTTDANREEDEKPTRVSAFPEAIAGLPQRGEPLPAGEQPSRSTEDPIHGAPTIKIPPEQVAVHTQASKPETPHVPPWHRVKSNLDWRPDTPASKATEAEPTTTPGRSTPPPPPTAASAALRPPPAPRSAGSASSATPENETMPLEPLLEEAEVAEERASAPPPTPAPRRVEPISVSRDPARLVSELPVDPERPTMEVNLGATTESNLYVGLDASVQSGGVFAVTYENWPVGTQVHLLITLPGGFEAEAHGTVEYLRGSPTASDGARPGVGVRFHVLTSDDLALLQRFMAKRPPIYLDS